MLNGEIRSKIDALWNAFWSGGTEIVWFYDMDADGMSLDDKRTELLPLEKLGPVPKLALSANDHAKNNLPDILARWRTLGFGVPALAGDTQANKMTLEMFHALEETDAPPAKAGTPYR